MSTMKSYLYIIAAAVIVIAAAFVVPIAPVKSFCLTCFGFMQQNVLIGAAAICAFIFLGNNHYWFIIAGCAIITALIIQFAIVGHNAAIITWVARVTAFMTIVFLMNFVRVFVNR